jgi:microcompartment protein CcmL/EutN
MKINAIGCIETTSISRGFQVADTMLKAADVELLINRTICPGKYMIVIAGDTDAVKASVKAGSEVADATEVDQFIIPNVHPQIFPAITGNVQVTNLQALGIIETFSVASLIEAADAAVKAADVELIQVHLAMAIGGKAYFTLTGDVAAVEAAIDAAVAEVKKKGLLVGKVVIPQPDPAILQDRI